MNEKLNSSPHRVTTLALGSALALTGIVAYLTANSPVMMNAIFGTPLMWVVMLAPLEV